jgi:hypothetical protein
MVTRSAARRVGLGLVGLALPALLAGCSHRGVSALPLSTTPPPCSAVTAATVNQILGTNVSAATGSPGTGSGSNTETCTYPGTAGGVTLCYEVGPTPAAFRQAQSSLRNATSISGLGAAAYSDQPSSSDPQQHRVAALFGTLEVSVTADASVSAEKSLLQTLNSHL